MTRSGDNRVQVHPLGNRPGGNVTGALYAELLKTRALHVAREIAPEAAVIAFLS